MPRPQRELDPDGGPLVDFARELRALRARAGDPKFAAMSRRTGRSKTALADAVGGRHLARWETVEDFVRACDGDPRAWREAWSRAKAAATEPPTADPSREPAPEQGPHAVPAPVVETEPVSAPVTAAPDPVVPVVPAPRRGGRRAVVLGTVLGLVLGVLLGAGSWAALAGPSTDPLSAAEALRAITVQNKVAIGPDALVEDRTPAYLSTVPLSYCATSSRSCKVPGTEMPSGAALVVNCQVEGQRMANFNRDEAASADNPYRADSSLWYRASFPDGRSGYLSEVYIVDDNRGGMGLPSCGPPPTALPAGG